VCTLSCVVVVFVGVVVVVLVIVVDNNNKNCSVEDIGLELGWRRGFSSMSGRPSKKVNGCPALGDLRIMEYPWVRHPSVFSTSPSRTKAEIHVLF
jgi:hypothetical protein